MGTLLRVSAVLLIALLSVGFSREGLSANRNQPPNVVYFPQTGHNLGGEFLHYWRQHGDVETFGYPISEQIQEDGQTVQYFERTVLELHPGDDWPVKQRLLGALAVEQLEDRGLLDPVAMNPATGCQQFGETAHQACGRFLDFWQDHGDVVVFGFPLSREFERDGLTVQIFERAVMEWHEDRGKVLLALLGIDASERSDIDRAPADRHPGAPDYAPGLFVSRPALDALELKLRNLVNGWDGQHALTITDLQTGETISINGSRTQLAACTIKIPIMVAVAQDVAAGKYTREEIEHLVAPAMGPSLTWPARELLRITGDGDIGQGVHRANAIMRELGAEHSLLTHPPGYFGEEYGYLETHNEIENLLTTDDLNRMLANLWAGDLLPEETSDYFWWSLTIATPFLDNSMGAPLPPDTPMYHKIGVLYEPWNTWNDAGIIVATRDGQPYAYAVSYLASDSPGSYRTAYANGQEISRLVWETFND